MYESLIFENKTIFYYYGGPQTYVVPENGLYKLECWGAEGGTAPNYANGGKGGYSVGIVELKKGQILYAYVGQRGADGGYGTYAAYNGGGAPFIKHQYVAGGGGASDIRLANGAWNSQTGLLSRLIVAGGGGGGGAENGKGYEFAGAGGGLVGQNANSYYTGYWNSSIYGKGGTQSMAGGPAYGGFGYGGVSSTNTQCGSGGGGWYGGGGQIASPDAGGGGGSGYVVTDSSYKPSGYAVSTEYYMSDAKLIAGTETMPTYSSGTEIGHTGDGVIAISYSLYYGKDLTVQHYAILQDNKYYIPTQNNFDFVRKSFTQVSLGYLKDITNFKNFMFDVNSMLTSIITNNGILITPVKYFKDYKIVKIIIKYIAADATSLSMYNYIINNNIPTISTIKTNHAIIKYELNNSDLLNYKLEILEKFNSSKELFHKLLSLNLTSDIKILIKYRGKLYGIDLELVEDPHDYILKAIDIRDINDYNINFNLFNIVIFFTKATSTKLNSVKYINYAKEKLTNVDDIVASYNDENIFIKSNSAKKYLYLNITNGLTDEMTSDLEKF